MSSHLSLLNAVMAGVGALLLISSIAVMSKDTPHAPRFSALLVLIGLLGQATSIWFGGWKEYLDTILFCGIAAFMLANRRMRCSPLIKDHKAIQMMKHREVFFSKASLIVSGATLVFMFILFFLEAW